MSRGRSAGVSYAEAVRAIRASHAGPVSPRGSSTVKEVRFGEPEAITVEATDAHAGAGLAVSAKVSKKLAFATDAKGGDDMHVQLPRGVSDDKKHSRRQQRKSVAF